MELPERKALLVTMVPLVLQALLALILKYQAHKALMAMTEPLGLKALPEMMVPQVRKAHKVNAVVMELLAGKARQVRKALKAPQEAPALSLVLYKVE